MIIELGKATEETKQKPGVIVLDNRNEFSKFSS
jgi:hypothetical protein